MQTKNINDEVKEMRAKYMAHEISHQAYYIWLADKIHVGVRLLPVSVDAIRKSTDEHLNDIPLKLWDGMDPAVRHLAHTYGIRAWSLCETVCVLKAVARREVADVH